MIYCVYKRSLHLRNINRQLAVSIYVSQMQASQRERVNYSSRAALIYAVQKLKAEVNYSSRAALINATLWRKCYGDKSEPNATYQPG